MQHTGRRLILWFTHRHRSLQSSKRAIAILYSIKLTQQNGVFLALEIFRQFYFSGEGTFQRPADCRVLHIYRRKPVDHAIPLTHALVDLVAANIRGVCSKVTFGATVEVGLRMYYAIKADAWKLCSTADSDCAVASAASAGGLLLCVVLMLWQKYQGQPVTHGMAPPVMLLAEGLYDQDQDMIDSASFLLPVQSRAIVALWVTVSAIGATGVQCDVLSAVLYYCLALVCRWKLNIGDSTIDRLFDGSHRET